MAQSGQRPVYGSGPWEVDLGRRELRAHGVPLPIGDRAFDIMEILVQSAGEVVTKDELLARVWPAAIVEQNTLQVHISAVRKALGADRGLLTTASGRGYRLLGGWAIRQVSASPDPTAHEPAASPEQPFMTNLPAAASALIGRAGAAQQVADLLSAYRAVTLTGPGGIGKTALALEVARRLFPIFQGDAWFVDLVSLSNAALVPSAVAGVLGLKFGDRGISPDAVGQAIGGRRLLLVLDNCEHVIDAAARLAETVVRQCPGTSILSTSREVLRIEGECVYRVPPLDVPPPHEAEPGNLLGHSAVQLFVARTAAVRSDFSVDGEDLAAIAAICRRLDGIPLALEFAAARAATLGLPEVAARLNDRFKLLGGGRRTALPRHQTLRATLDWSYELLPEAERCLLRRLAVFPAGFTLEAAGAVMGESGAAAAASVAGVANLVAKSLVARDGTGPAGRWRLLDTIRAYALEKLGDSGEADLAARRLAEFCRDLLAPATPGAPSPPTHADMARYVREIDTLRAALDWCFAATGDRSLGLALTVAAVPLWTHASLMEECRRRVEQALASLASQLGADSHREMQLLWALGTALLLTRGGGAEMNGAWTAALRLAESLDDGDYLLRALWGLFVDNFSHGNHRMALALAESFRRFAGRGADPAELLIGERMTGTALHVLGDQAGARRHIEHMLERYRPAAHRLHIIRFQFDQPVAAHSFRSRILWLQGFADQALEAAAGAVDDARALDHPLSLFYALVQAACPVALLAGDLAAAARFVEQLLQLAARQAVEPWAVWGQCFSGVLLGRQGEPAAGLRLLQSGLARLPEAAFHLHYTPFLAETAQILGGLGDVAQGLATIDQALARCERNQEGWCIAELLRIKGELLLTADEREAGAQAEQHFQQSLDWSRRQAVLSWELRTALSVARLRARQDRPDEARQALAPVYRRFTEGFETADLRRARAMLQSLPPRRAVPGEEGIPLNGRAR